MLILAAALSANSAYAHAISVGFTNAGPGSVTVWLGTYLHGTPTLQGSMKLEGTGATIFAPNTLAFSLLTASGVSNKPAGLVDGVNNFYAPATTGALVGSEVLFNTIACPACGPVEHWQGATFTGLLAGTYQFTYVPIANPTVEWTPFNPNLNGTFELTSNVVSGVPEPTTAGMLMIAGVASLFARQYRKGRR